MSVPEGGDAWRRDRAVGGNRLTVPSPLDDVCVYAIDLNEIAIRQEVMVDELDEAERARAHTFKNVLHRDHFVARRWWRRRVLAEAAGVESTLIGIEHNRLGKPSVISPESLRYWSISSSHSNGVAVMAWSQSRTIGVDIAACQACHATPDAASVFMNDNELHDWQRGCSFERASLFYRLWTRKEATLKAMGTGFATDPRTVDVRGTQVGHTGNRLLNIVDLEFRPDWACALAGF